MKKLFMISLLMLLCNACATIIDGKKQQLAFDSNEKDVEIYINDTLSCRTPCMIEADRTNKKLTVVAKKEGFQERTLFLDKGVNTSAAFNVLSLWFSTFGFTTDLASGDMWEYQPNSIYVVMTKEPKTTAERQKFKEQNQIRDFVLRNFDALENESDDEQGTGEYIKTLAAMTHLSTNEINSILQNTYVATDCAERIIGLMLTK